MKVVLLNSTWDTGHFGCVAVHAEMHVLLKRYDCEVIGDYLRHEPPDLNVLDKADLVLINGEGCIHDGNYEILLGYGQDYPCILTNASMCSLTMHSGDLLDKFQHVTVREGATRDYLVESHGFEPEVVPDVIFNKNWQRKGNGTRHIITDSAYRPKFTGYNWKAKGLNAVETLLAAETVTAGRFHAACVCAVARIPFNAYPSNTWKIAGLMRDMGVPQRFFIDPVVAMEFPPEFPVLDIDKYVSDAWATINQLYAAIGEGLYG